jgi:rubrerythrin
MKTGTPATKRQIELYEVFKMAVSSEKAAQEMYDSALSYCDDEVMRQILAGLRDDEKRHEKELIVLYSQLKKIIELDPEASRLLAERATPERATR